MKNNGEPAFPVRTRTIKWQDEENHIGHDGMTLRDYFAAHAPVAPWTSYEPVMEPEPLNPGTPRGSSEWIKFSEKYQEWRKKWNLEYPRQWPFYYADAMIAEREK